MLNGRRLGALLLAGVLGTGLAACGGDDGDEEASGSASASGTEETTTTESSEDSGSEASGSDGDDDVDLPAGLDEDCEVFIEAFAAFGSALGGGGEAADLGDIADAFDELADELPEELQDDVEVIAASYREFAEGTEGIDMSDPESFSDPEISQQFAEAGEALSTPEVQEANANLQAYVAEECPAAG